jgi:hypothetical protein
MQLLLSHHRDAEPRTFPKPTENTVRPYITSNDHSQQFNGNGFVGRSRESRTIQRVLVVT